MRGERARRRRKKRYRRGCHSGGWLFGFALFFYESDGKEKEKNPQNMHKIESSFTIHSSKVNCLCVCDIHEIKRDFPSFFSLVRSSAGAVFRYARTTVAPSTREYKSCPVTVCGICHLQKAANMGNTAHKSNREKRFGKLISARSFRRFELRKKLKRCCKSLIDVIEAEAFEQEAQ